MHFVTNFDGKTWLGIAGIVFMLVVFFKGMGTKEGGSGGSNNGGKNNSSNNTNNTNNTSNNNNNGVN